MTGFRLFGRVFVVALILSLPFGAVSSETAVSMDGVHGEELILEPGYGLTEAMVEETCPLVLDGMSVNGVIVDIAQCENYTAGGLLRRLCCSMACHKYDVVCYSDCVHGD